MKFAVVNLLLLVAVVAFSVGVMHRQSQVIDRQSAIMREQRDVLTKQDVILRHAVAAASRWETIAITAMSQSPTGYLDCVCKCGQQEMEP